MALASASLESASDCAKWMGSSTSPQMQMAQSYESACWPLTQLSRAALLSLGILSNLLLRESGPADTGWRLRRRRQISNRSVCWRTIARRGLQRGLCSNHLCSHSFRPGADCRAEPIALDRFQDRQTIKNSRSLLVTTVRLLKF
jgi:hypothetical protein